jgi:MoaA/NifB/PqqE/SkfB family radical SAM enzyme
MYIGELVLEITRRCNIQCRHCLRGKAQAKSMTFETLRKTLVDVSGIGTITFTGGEPSLNVPFIRYFTEYVRGYRIPVNSFYVITNGKMASKAMADALTKLSWWCSLPDSCSLIMSEDNFHKGYNQWPAKELYEYLPFYHDGQRKAEILYPLDQGLAYENGLGMRSERPDPIILSVDENGDVSQNDGTVYVNVNGDIIPSSDLSYDNQDLEKVGNVYEKPLSEILKQFIHIDNEWLQEVA